MTKRHRYDTTGIFQAASEISARFFRRRGLFVSALCRYFIKTAFQPAFELEDAKRLCAQLGAELSIIELDALANPDVAKNPANRCYYCKTGLFGALQKRALEDGYTVLLDGTNASDEAGDRPGMQALSELHVLSPLRLCGLTKSQIRELSREAGLFTWDKPAYACLATRIPTRQRITNELPAVLKFWKT